MVALLCSSFFTAGFLTSSSFSTSAVPFGEELPSDQQEIYVRVNQVGYSPDTPKIAHALARAPIPELFTVVNAATGQTALKGNVTTVEGQWGEFDYHAQLNFSELRKAGTYFIRLGTAQSSQFQIRADAYSELPDQLLDFMRQQRCGYNPLVDAVCHSFDGRTAYGPSAPGTYLDATGGWHDAGDQLKYLLTTSNATAQLLLAYQLAGSREGMPRKRGRRTEIFADRFNELGQPGANGLVDILDEARWGLNWMLKLHPAPEQLYHQVADDRDHKGFRLPQNETVDYGWGAGSYRVVYFADGKQQGLREFKSHSNGVANLAGRYAAAMALGYQIWKDDPRLGTYAQKLLRAGKEVYAMGRKQEGVQQGNSYGAPYRYEETTWADDMEWGAAELMRATGNISYLRDAKRYASLSAAVSWMGSGLMGHYQYYPFMNLGHFRLYDLVDVRFKRQLANYYLEGIVGCDKGTRENPFGANIPFIWCSNNLAVALATQCWAYEKMTGEARYRELAARQRDWLLGRNPWGVSMFTGIPANGKYPKDVHLFTTAILKREIRGGLVDGPVRRGIFQTLKGVNISQPDPFAAFQDDRAVYHDDIKDYSTNEPTMDGTASAILLWSVMR